MLNILCNSCDCCLIVYTRAVCLISRYIIVSYLLRDRKYYTQYSNLHCYSCSVGDIAYNILTIDQQHNHYVTVYQCHADIAYYRL